MMIIPMSAGMTNFFAIGLISNPLKQRTLGNLKPEMMPISAPTRAAVNVTIARAPTYAPMV
jgi:hypothetical protein